MENKNLPKLQELEVNGEKLSPTLPEGIKNYLIDIDGTICDDIPNEQPERMATAQHYPDALSTLNGWFDEGHIIYFFTSRVEAHRSISSGVQSIIDQLKELEGRRVILAINKIDRVKSDALLALTQQLNAAFAFEKTFMISAERGHGVPDLRAWLGQELPEGPWLYPEDQIADLPLRMIAAEMTREKLTLRLHQELPYQLTVETESWEERPDGSARVDQVIYVVRDGHKGILLGNKGETIKAVSKAAREELEGFLERRVHLFCKVKVRQKWLEDAARYSEMGLDFRDGNG